MQGGYMADNLIVSVSRVGKGFGFEYGDQYNRPLLKKAAQSILDWIAEQDEIDALIEKGLIVPNVADPSGYAQYAQYKELK
jgi:hypothetical protein